MNAAKKLTPAQVEMLTDLDAAPIARRDVGRRQGTMLALCARGLARTKESAKHGNILTLTAEGRALAESL